MIDELLPALRDALLEATAVVACCDVATLGDTTLLEDLDLDSLGLSTLVLELEERFGEEVPLEVLERFEGVEELRTLGDVFAVFATWKPAVDHGAGSVPP